MQESYDFAFENFRLEQLCEQFLTGAAVDGEIVFHSVAAENRLDAASFFFSDADLETLDASGFKTSVLALLDDLIIYRARCQEQNCRDGVLRLEQSRPSVVWLPNGAGDVMVRARRNV
ncbi:hypothetical protein [Pseudomonas sp. URMO17WK12:I4]|uniref:hypothetical protein n=1 Tax=Pseudomonas sp. URMO17WK12:I4 TaxID=1283292 RepID=UPI0004813F41|nr:hypothetical protein [Pseudomonas sp. URMO17WK12:I4]